jgi:hypothetical protein
MISGPSTSTMWFVCWSVRSTDEEPHEPPLWLLTCGFAESRGFMWGKVAEGLHGLICVDLPHSEPPRVR